MKVFFKSTLYLSLNLFHGICVVCGTGTKPGITLNDDIDMIKNTMSPYPVDEAPTVTSFPTTTAGKNWNERAINESEIDGTESNTDNIDATSNGSKGSSFLERILDAVNGWLDVFTVDVTNEMRSLIPDDLDLAAKKAMQEIKKMSRSKRNSKINLAGNDQK